MTETRSQKLKAAQGISEAVPANDDAMPSGAEAASSSRQATSSNDKTIPYRKEEPPAKHYQPHGTFVKKAFEDIEIARDFFAAHLKNLGSKQKNKDLELEPKDEDLELETEDENLGLEPKDFANFKLSPTERMLAWQTKIISDVIYHGTIDGQNYYIDTEHQSSRDGTMFNRFLEYTMALFKEHEAQNRPGWPVVLTICLYHDPIKNQPWGNTTTLQSCFASQKHANRSPIKSEFTLVDLVSMSKDTIATHKKAAIVEWALKYAYKRDSNKKDPHKGRKEYFTDMVQLIKQQINTDTEDNFLSLKRGFKDALIEYISYVCKGSNSLELIKQWP